MTASGTRVGRRGTGSPPEQAAEPRRVVVLASISELPEADWNRLADPNEPLWTREFLLAMERSHLGPDRCEYLAVERDGRISALLPVAHFAQLNLPGVLGHQARAALRPIWRLAPRLARINALFAGHLLSDGRILCTADEDPAVAFEVLLSSLPALARRHGSRWVVWKDIPDSMPRSPQTLDRHGFFRVPALPDAVLTLPVGSFNGFVAALPAKPRRNVRAKLRRLAGSAIHLEDVTDVNPYADVLIGLYHNVLDRAESRLEVLTAQFLRELSAEPKIHSRFIVAMTEDRTPVAFLLWVNAGCGSAALRVGLDYRVCQDAALYHNVHFRGIEHALEAGSTRMEFFQTAYEAKLELGCHLIPLSHAVTHRNPVIRAVLARFLPNAVALGPRPGDRTPRSA